MSLTSSTIGRKVAMALSGLFLVLFLTQHFTINIISVFSEAAFNEVSHFMGNNPLVQFVLQPVLIFGVIFHFIMGFVLEIQNRKARIANEAGVGVAQEDYDKADTAFSDVKATFLGPRNDLDKLIAATAKHHRLTVVTRNEKDFTGLSVEVLNPFS